MDSYVIERSGNACGVRLTADLTASMVPELQADLRRELRPEVREVQFDLGATHMLDSSGIGLLIATCNSLTARQGRMSVNAVSPDIFQLLQSMRLITRLNVSARTA